MANQWPTPLFVSGGQNASAAYVDFTTAQPIGLPVFESPIPSTSAEYIFKQPFMQFRANFTPAALGAVHPSAGQTPDYSAYFLVNEGERRDIEGGLVRWIRTYAIKPATHDEYETYSYNFIGFTGKVWTQVGGAPGLGGQVIQNTGAGTNFATPFTGANGWTYGRPRFSPPGGVSSRVRHDYFIAGPTAGGLITPDYASPGNIPSSLALLYKNTELSVFLGLYTDFLLDAIGSFTSTQPARTEYNGWMANSINLRFLAGVAVPAWGSYISYTPGDVVLYGTLPNVSQYTCIMAVQSATTPPSDPTHWSLSSAAWSSAGVYNPGDFVTDSSVAYNCILAVGPSATHPASDTTHWNVYQPGQIVAEDSRLSRWQGNIWLRQTRYILSQ